MGLLPLKLLQQRSPKLKKLQRRWTARKWQLQPNLKRRLQPNLKQKRPPRQQRRPRPRLLKPAVMSLLLKQLGNAGRRAQSKFRVLNCFYTVMFCNKIFIFGALKCFLISIWNMMCVCVLQYLSLNWIIVLCRSTTCYRLLGCLVYNWNVTI